MSNLHNLVTLTDDDVHRRESALNTILEQMDIPALRCDTTSFSNLRWLNRNLAINNFEHPLFNTANELTTWLLKNSRTR